MAKTKYVKVESDYTEYVAYRDPEGYGWEVSIDGNRFYVPTESLGAYIEFFKAVKQAEEK